MLSCIAWIAHRLAMGIFAMAASVSFVCMSCSFDCPTQPMCWLQAMYRPTLVEVMAPQAQAHSACLMMQVALASLESLGAGHFLLELPLQIPNQPQRIPKGGQKRKVVGMEQMPPVKTMLQTAQHQQ